MMFRKSKNPLAPKFGSVHDVSPTALMRAGSVAFGPEAVITATYMSFGDRKMLWSSTSALVLPSRKRIFRAFAADVVFTIVT